MEHQKILSQAMSIARDALAKAERADIEETVRSFEHSAHPVLQSLARAYRMLQSPFR